MLSELQLIDDIDIFGNSALTIFGGSRLTSLKTCSGMVESGGLAH
jgi:hypothetical protein